MKCIVRFTVGGEHIDLDLDNKDPDSPLTNDEIIETLKNNIEKRLNLYNLILNTWYKDGKIKPFTIKDLKSSVGLKGNTDLNFLSKEFGINFPEGVTADILLINNLNINKQNIYGRIINSNGHELFIIKNDKEDIYKLYNFLTLRKLIEDLSFIFDENSNFYKNLNLCLELKKSINNIFELILDFIYNKKEYEKLYFTNTDNKKENVYSYLNSVVNTILEYSNRVVFIDPSVNTINQLKTHLDNNNAFISYNALYGIMQLYHDFKGTKKEFKDLYDEKGWDILIDELTKLEPEFTWSYLKKSNKGIILKSSPKTLYTKYGIGYDTIYTYDIIDDDFYGYKIYSFIFNGKQKYVASRGFLTEDSFSKLFDDKTKLEEYIKNSVSRLSIKENNLLEFKYKRDSNTEIDSYYINSNQSLIVGSVIESIDIPIKKNLQIYYRDENSLFFLKNLNYNNFSEIIKNWNISEETKNNILSNINTPEKITIFIYKINEILKDDRTNEEELNNIVNSIINANKKYYYIDTRLKSNDLYKYRVIPTDPLKIDNYKRNKHIPIIELISSINKTLSSKFGVNINMITSSELIEKFPDIDANTTKAFIRNGEIYINTTISEATDSLHEFTHLILGILKSNKNLRANYELLLIMVANTKEGKNKINKLRDTYENISEMDLMEEVFVSLFSDHLIKNLSPNSEEIFKTVDKYMEDATKIIFNTNISNLSSFYGKSIESIFSRFSSDITSLKLINFADTLQYRRISNWINEQIKNGNIKEECYG